MTAVATPDADHLGNLTALPLKAEWDHFAGRRRLLLSFETTIRLPDGRLRTVPISQDAGDPEREDETLQRGFAARVWKLMCMYRDLEKENAGLRAENERNLTRASLAEGEAEKLRQTLSGLRRQQKKSAEE